MEYKLGELCIMKSGGTPRRGTAEFYGGDIPWIKISDFKNSNSEIILETEETITQKGLEAINNRLFPKGTLLLAMYGSVGKTAFTGIETSCNQAILGMLPKDESILNLKYLKYWFEENKEKLVNQGRGVTLNNISATIVKKQKINLPDLPTQNKIVNLLDKASALLQKRDESIALLDKLLTDKFYHLFGDTYLNQKSFEEHSIDSLCENIVDCPHSTPKYANQITTFPCIRTSEIKNGEIDWESMKYLDEENHIKRISRLEPLENDLVFGREGTVGEIALIPEKTTLSLGQRVMLFRVKKEIVTPIYFWASIRSNGIQHKIKLKTIGATVKRINIKEVKLMNIPIPPIELQNQFETIYHKIQAQKETLIQSKTELEHLYNSLLQRAFSGQLNFNIDIELDALLAAINIEQDTEKEKHNIKEIATVYAGRLLERIEEQKFDNQTQYQQAKQVVFQMLEEGIIEQAYDKNEEALKLKLV